MPELPEVETTRRGLSPLIEGVRLERIVVRDPRLRWPVQLPASLRDVELRSLGRRAKYLLFNMDHGALIVHLGMSGSLRIVNQHTPLKTHDHVDLVFAGDRVVRYHDPRRFGSIHWQANPVDQHWLLQKLGPEPLGDEFDGAYLKRLARGRRVAVKNFIMDAHVVVGVGNIYAAESLFRAGIRPTVAAHRVTLTAYESLARAIRFVLQRSIHVGGTTLRDFVDHDGNPGYFKQLLNVYGRDGQPCRVCGTTLRLTRLGQRSTVFCPKCQRFQGFREVNC